jgi:hypothetical protein
VPTFTDRGVPHGHCGGSPTDVINRKQIRTNLGSKEDERKKRRIKRNSRKQERKKIDRKGEDKYIRKKGRKRKEVKNNKKKQNK